LLFGLRRRARFTGETMFPPWAPFFTHRSACFTGETSFPRGPPSGVRVHGGTSHCCAEQVRLRDEGDS